VRGLILIESKNIKLRFHPNCFQGKKRLAKFIPDKSAGEEREKKIPPSRTLAFYSLFLSVGAR